MTAGSDLRSVSFSFPSMDESCDLGIVKNRNYGVGIRTWVWDDVCSWLREAQRDYRSIELNILSFYLCRIKICYYSYLLSNLIRAVQITKIDYLPFWGTERIWFFVALADFVPGEAAVKRFSVLNHLVQLKKNDIMILVSGRQFTRFCLSRPSSRTAD